MHISCNNRGISMNQWILPYNVAEIFWHGGIKATPMLIGCCRAWDIHRIRTFFQYSSMNFSEVKPLLVTKFNAHYTAIGTHLVDLQPVSSVPISSLFDQRWSLLHVSCDDIVVQEEQTKTNLKEELLVYCQTVRTVEHTHKKTHKQTLEHTPIHTHQIYQY